MLEITSALSYAKYDDIKGGNTTHKMWKTLSNIYGGDDNFKRAKRESLRGNFDDMKIKEGENAAQYGARMKEVVSSIRSLGGQLPKEIVSSKYLRTLLPIYAIRVSAIQELRCVPRNTLTFEGIIGRLTAFELSNFDNYKLDNFDSTFKAKMTIKDTKKMQTKKNGKGKHVSSDSSTNEDDVDQLEALLARRFTEEKANSEVSCLSFVSIAMKLVTLQLDAHKRRITRMEANSRTREKRVMRITRTKARDATLLKKTQMTMMMK